MPTSTNVRSGIGSVRDEALNRAGRGGRREHVRAYTLASRERSLVPLSKTVAHADLRAGDFASVREGCVIPLSEQFPFAGIIGAIGEERGRYVASLFIRGTFHSKIEGLTATVKSGALVYATEAQGLTLDAAGVRIGELIAIENAEQAIGIIGFHLASDTRPFEWGGNRRGGLVQTA